MKIGIVGTGSIAQTMTAEFQRAGLACIAVCSRRAETGQAMAEKFGIPKVYTSLSAMAEDPEAELVYIATPNSLHYAQTKTALLAGKHVLCEKPFVPAAAQAQELAALARERGLLLFEAITTAYHPNYARAKRYLKEIGPVKAVCCTFCQYSSRYDALLAGQTPPVFDPAFCGGALMDINLYNIHFAAGLFGAPSAVHYYPNRHPNGIDTSGVLVLEYPGFVCSCTGAKDSAARNSAQIIGSRGSIRIEPGASNCRTLTLTRRGGDEETSEYTESPWFYEVRGLLPLLERRDADACRAALEQTNRVVSILEAARRDAGLGF